MKFGVMITIETELADVVPLARRAEELGYDFLGFGEHVFFNGPVTNAFISLSAAAGATERIRLLSALTILPVYPAALAAKMAATLDGVSGGRFDMGIGIGGENPDELRACGADPRTRGARTDEGLEVMTRLWAGERLTFQGRFNTIENALLEPLPIQRPRPPLWIGGRKPAAMRRAGRFADVWFPYMVDPAQLADGLAQARAAAVEHGRQAEEISGAVFSWSLVGKDAAETRRTALSALQRIYRQDFTPLADRYVPAGTPDQVAARFVEYAQAGADKILFTPACPGRDQVAAAMELFAREVIPAVREAVGA
jgi:probable F420-dependent oxidoreductase